MTCSTSSRERQELRGRVRKRFWLDPQLLAVAQRALGAASEQEAVERALDLVAFRAELAAGARALCGLEVSRIDSPVDRTI